MLPLNAKVLAGCMLGFGLIAIGTTVDANLWGNHRGYAPEQPIEFSHRLHAGELAIDCLYCHYGARESRTAGIPAASICMGCHKHVQASFDVVQSEKIAAQSEQRAPRRIISTEIRKLYDALGLNDDAEPKPGAQRRPIRWVRVHNLPDFVAFDHSVHVASGLACQECHGPVQTFDRMQQFSDLSMGWCLDCHRTERVDGMAKPGHPTTNCAACHY